MFESLALYGGVQYQHDTIANKALAAFENSFLLSLIRNTTKISPVGISESSLISLMLERLRQDDISKQLLQAAFATGLAHSSPQSADSTQMAFNSHIDRMLERLMPPNFARDIKGEQISYIGPEFDTSELDILDRDRLICDIENFLHPDSLDFSYCGYGLDQFIKARIPKKVKLCLSRGDFH
jgi:hypothetical protein